MTQAVPVLVIVLFMIAIGVAMRWIVIVSSAREPNLASDPEGHETGDGAPLYEEVELPLPTIEAYRERFAHGPVGLWVATIDDYMGMGFAGVSGKSSETLFRDDGTGRFVSEYEEIHFAWRCLGDRVIEVQCLEHIPPVEVYTDEELAEDRQWHRVEYDFMIPSYLKCPVIFDVAHDTSARILEGTINPFLHLDFLECFGGRFGGPQKLSRYRLKADAGDCNVHLDL